MRTNATFALAISSLLLAACATTSTPTSTDNELRRSLVLHWGLRGVDSADERGDSDDLGPVIGFEYASRGEGSLGWEAGLSYSQQEEFLSFASDEEEIDQIEATFGGRATYLGFSDHGAGLLPYASAGLAALALLGRESDEGALGAYLGGGLCYAFGGGFTMGAKAQWLASSSDYVESYGQFTLQFGWTF